MLRLSMNELTTMRWSFEEDVKAYSNAGFDGIGVWRPKLTDIGVEAGIELIERYNLSCSNLLWAGGFTGSDGFSFRDSVQDAREAIRTADSLGAECLVIYSGAWGGHTRQHARRLLRNALKFLLPLAEEFGVVLALEPMHPGCGSDWTFLNTIEETLELIDPFESPYLKVVLDTYHFGWQNPHVALLADIVDRIAIVHLGDGMSEPDGEQNRCQLGTGSVPLSEIISTLTNAGYKGFFDIELLGENVEPFDYPTLILGAADSVRTLVS